MGLTFVWIGLLGATGRTPPDGGSLQVGFLRNLPPPGAANPLRAWEFLMQPPTEWMGLSQIGGAGAAEASEASPPGAFMSYPLSDSGVSLRHCESSSWDFSGLQRSVCRANSRIVAPSRFLATASLEVGFLRNLPLTNPARRTPR